MTVTPLGYNAKTALVGVIRQALKGKREAINAVQKLTGPQVDRLCAEVSSRMAQAEAASRDRGRVVLDGYKDVRLLIIIGRTLPNVLEVEGYAGALTGIEPVKTAPPADRAGSTAPRAASA